MGVTRTKAVGVGSGVTVGVTVGVGVGVILKAILARRSSSRSARLCTSMYSLNGLATPPAPPPAFVMLWKMPPVKLGWIAASKMCRR